MADLQDNSEKVRQEIQRRLIAGLNKGNDFLIGEAKTSAPVGKTGMLRDNTEVVKEASAGHPVAVGASKMPYAAIVNRHDSPFWTAAWLRMKAQWGGFFRG